MAAIRGVIAAVLAAHEGASEAEVLEARAKAELKPDARLDEYARALLEGRLEDVPEPLHTVSPVSER